jgi:hypothetical protein
MPPTHRVSARRTGLPAARAVRAILRIGFVAGTLDITEDLLFNAFRHITPTMVFQFIASGVMDGASFHSGLASVILGVMLHYAIALSWTAIFFAASRKFSALIRRPVISGLLYGIGVYLVMNIVVVPLSRVPQSTAAMTLASRVNGVLAVLFCIGLTISLLVQREAGSPALDAPRRT